MTVGSRGGTAVTSSLAAVVVLVLVTGCGGGAKYAGKYKRDLYNEGEVNLTIGSDGTVELTLPAPRWADNPTMKGKATFKGDTLVFPADTAGSKCASGEAAYVLSQGGDSLGVAGVGFDPCGGRHAGLQGSWKKA